MSRKDFYIYRFNLLQSYFDGSITNGKNFINNVDAYIYAWSHEIYPIFDICFADEEFEADFKIRKAYVDKVTETLDQFESKKIDSYPDYYTLQTHLGGKSCNIDLSEVLRYLYLSNKFDVNLWTSILSNAPIEAENITKPFSKDNDVIIFLS